MSCLKTGLGVRWGRTGLALSLLWDLPVLGTRDQIFGISHHPVLLPYCLGQLYWFTELDLCKKIGATNAYGS